MATNSGNCGISQKTRAAYKQKTEYKDSDENIELDCYTIFQKIEATNSGSETAYLEQKIGENWIKQENRQCIDNVRNDIVCINIIE